ncbi:MAG: ATP-grasp domain-containing protein [Chloroflexi bacterium]|nr:ATP-grasp domain-containing protein [Chloroflexota bacterium]
MSRRVAIVYNEPYHSHYDAVGEEKAVLGVLEAVAAVHQALLELDYSVIRMPLPPPLERAAKILRDLDTDIVFNLFEGFDGYPETEAIVTEIISAIGLPSTGCPSSMLRLALNKAKMKAVLKSALIPTPDFQLLNPETLPLFHLDYPCIVKPCCEDASHGMSADSIVNNFSALERQVRFIDNTYRGGVLVEKFIDGREFSATVLGDSGGTVLPISEIAYSLPPGMPRLLTFAAKWEPSSPYFQGTSPVCPVDIGDKEREDISKTALAAFKVLGGVGYARVDMRLDAEGQVNVIEVNPNPDISPGYGASRQAEVAGITYPKFIGKIMQLALEKQPPWASASVS